MADLKKIEVAEFFNTGLGGSRKCNLTRLSSTKDVIYVI